VCVVLDSLANHDILIYLLDGSKHSELFIVFSQLSFGGMTFGRLSWRQKL